MIAGIKVYLPGDSRDTEAVPVVADPFHHAPEQPARPCARKVSESERIETGDRACSHREYVPHDPADTRGGSLVGLYSRGVIVAFDFERDGHPLAYVNQARILFAGADQEPPPFPRESLEDRD